MRILETISISNNSRYYVKDHQGNIRQVTDSVGTVLQDNHYYPYGMQMAESSDVIATNSMSMGSGWMNGAANPYRYAGNELLTLRNMHLGDFHARVYDYATGRFLQPDPLREKYMGLPAYLYCAANPVNYIDSDGNLIIFINGYLGWGSPEGGSIYWNGTNSSFVTGAKDTFGDSHTFFTNIDHEFSSSAEDRISMGYQYARDNFQNWIEQMEDGEHFRLVSHSMGAAFSKGIEKYLKEQGGVVDYNNNA